MLFRSSGLQFTVSREEQTTAVQTWRIMIHRLVREEQMLAKYWPDSFLRNQEMYISDLKLRQDEDMRFRRLLRICHPFLSPRLVAMSPGCVPYSDGPLPHARASSSISPSRASTGELLAVIIYALTHDQDLPPEEQRSVWSL